MEREKLKSRLGFILLSAGCAIGIGNVWKFPYIAGQGGGGVQLSALNPNSDDDKNCEAYKLVTKYMTKYYPEWSDRYDPVLRSYISYATPATGTEYKETWSGNFSWNLDGTGLSDPEGYANMSAAEILADLFGEPMPTTCENAVYLGIKGYGTKAADGKSMERDAFTHLFSVNGKTMEFTLANDDGKYAIQNKLQEGYVYDLSTQGSVVTDANLAAATAEGKITAVSTSAVTIGGKEYPYTAMYQTDKRRRRRHRCHRCLLSRRQDREGLRRHRLPHLYRRALHRARPRHAR